MKKFLKIFIPLFILGALVFQFRSALLGFQKNALPFFSQVGNQITHQVSNQIFPKAPCAQPILYTLGAFDTQFNITQKYFLSALSDAEAIWEKPFGKELFAYSENLKNENVLKINLVYDFRQQATSKLAGLGIVVKDNRATYDTLKAKFTDLKTKLAVAKSDYNASVASYNQRQSAYETQVQSWNAQGGAPKAEFDKLQAEKVQLDAELSELRAKQTRVNTMVDEINAVVVVLNRLAATLNLSVDNYNTAGTGSGESFEEGVYISDGTNKEIDIYEFSSRAKLVRVLAHELGHALGLEHVNDPKSIMYKINQSANIIPTADDMAALAAKCSTK